MCKNAVKKFLFVIIYVLDWYKTQERYNNVILGNGGVLRFILECRKN